MLAGGCQCGAVRYAVALDALPPVLVCHCRECQKQSAAAFGLSMPVRLADLLITGRLESWERDTDVGTRTRCFFCPRCGSRLYHRSSRPGDSVNVKPGSLDDTRAVMAAAHIWVSRRQPWVAIDPALPAHPTQPEDMATWRAGWPRRS